MLQLKEVLKKYNIPYLENRVPQKILKLINNENILKYLSCMGQDIYLHRNTNGVALTTLYSVENILEEAFCEENLLCYENGYLLIGNGPNGDLLCINVDTELVGYAFHDDLWEGNYDDFCDIYVEIPFSISEFIMLAMEDKSNYPYDGTKAEQYVQE